MKYFSYLNTSKTILQLYKGDQPFGIFIKDFFRQHKKYGSKDRKQISHLCYCYFRTGKIFNGYSLEDAIIGALFLCTTAANDMLQQLNAEWNVKATMGISEKCNLLGVTLADIFPWMSELSNEVDKEKFCQSLLIQPDLFLRIRPGFHKAVTSKLEKSGISFEMEGQCIRLSNSTKIEEIFIPDQEVVIQDYNSQQVGKFFQNAFANISMDEGSANVTRAKPAVWDCCAASGGKSIMLYDLLPAIHLTVSDVRKNILLNLAKRFEAAGIKKYRSFVVDLAGEKVRPGERYNLIIADAPCSGSGTWARTPEQLFYFNAAEIERYSQLQKKIVKNIVPCLSDSGKLVYITCSVFKKENEELVKFLQNECGLQLESMSLLKGYEKKADTLFVAVLSRKGNNDQQQNLQS